MNKYKVQHSYSLRNAVSKTVTEFVAEVLSGELDVKDSPVDTTKNGLAQLGFEEEDVLHYF